MSQITWRNVDAPKVGDAAYAGNSASTSLSRGFNTLAGVVQSVQDMDNANWENQKRLNTERLLGQIQGTENVAALEALAPTMTPEALQGEYGAQYDLKAVREALMGQNDRLVGQERAATRFEWEGNAEQRAQKDQLLQEAAAGRDAARFRQETTLFNQKQLDRKQQENLSTRLTDIFDNVPATEQQARELLRKSPEFQALDAQEQVAALSLLSNQYGARYGMTSEDKADFELFATQQEAEYGAQIQQQQAEITALQSQYPTDLGNPDLQSLIDSKKSAREYIMEKSPDNNLDTFDEFGDRDGVDAVNLFQEKLDNRFAAATKNGKPLPYEKNQVMLMAAFLANQTSDKDYDSTDVANAIEEAIGILDRQTKNKAYLQELLPSRQENIRALHQQKLRTLKDRQDSYRNAKKLKN